jgi:hypothetical protein
MTSRCPAQPVFEKGASLGVPGRVDPLNLRKRQFFQLSAFGFPLSAFSAAELPSGLLQ